MIKMEAPKCFPAWEIFIEMKELVHTMNTNERSKHSSPHDEYVETGLVLTLRASNIRVTILVFGIQLLFQNACWELTG